MTVPDPSTITLCIPTYRRPGLLREAIDSCLAQSYRPLQLLIGDDSGDFDSRRMTDALRLPVGVSLTHIVHAPVRRQAGNVNWLFDNALGARLVLLHDDDYLLPGGLDALVSAWDALPHAACAYGGQVVVSAAGVPLPRDSESLQKRYGRVAENAGPQPSAVTAGLLQQIPNDAFLVDTQLARQTRYRSEAEIGRVAVDTDFGIRLGIAAGQRKFIYVHRAVAAYRLTEASILRTRGTGNGQHLLYAQVERLRLAAEDEPARATCLRRLSAEAALDAAMAGERAVAVRILLSRHYRLGYFDPRTLFRVLAATSPALGRWLNARLSNR